jgi:hypothetical protein
MPSISHVNTLSQRRCPSFKRLEMPDGQRLHGTRRNLKNPYEKILRVYRILIVSKLLQPCF